MRTFKPENNDEWFEFRRQHLTSTELRDLHLSRTARQWQELREQKETGKRWGGNDYTVWGTAREPVLAPLVVEVDSRLVYNADPQTIIINKDDERLCGTPDLFSEDGEVIGEIKTAKHPFTGGYWHDWCPDGYYLQVQANMWHAGAEACVLLVEYYQEQDGEFTPDGYEYQVIHYDPKVVEGMQRTAAEWFAWLEGTTPDWMGEVTSLEDADEVEGLVAQLADAEEKPASWSDLAKTYKKDLLKLLGDSYAGTHAGYKVSVSTTKDSKTFDSKAFKTAHPDLYAEFNTKTRRGSTRLRLTKVVN
ncbi:MULTISPECIES: YqaJ viral recombinase family protein [Corynebacterium]|uniref:YqaJ viral recombinase family protein n=1 Tax=Corynebacterium TaxID=1716 RepID=UPI001EF25440|nr:YqaJ viral recombinase family protein [Corynebacterium kefirresidentii]MCG7241954.1 YqaJ viral recombinase family protein [Corynebacterium kefirresidentii]MCG7284294.1 YqaJ viral recombinase family protein [Corynebacterium kefirresidentii]